MMNYSHYQIFFYLLAAIFFIFSLHSMTSPQTAKSGNIMGIAGMILALGISFVPPFAGERYVFLIVLIGAVVGIYLALKIHIKALPEMVAAFNGLGGLSAVLISIAQMINGDGEYFDNVLGLIIGSLAFSGSLVAFLKLHNLMKAQPIVFAGQHIINASLALACTILCIVFVLYPQSETFYILAMCSVLLGFLLVLPIGGADMPIAISILNAYSGLAAVGIGFSMHNVILIVAGALVGASGAILAYVMTKAMNRSIANIVTGSFSTDEISNMSDGRKVHEVVPQEAAFLLENCAKIIIVPGYGMAVSQAQSALKKMVEVLQEKYDVSVKYAIHPVAGRMPGHMNVLLAEAGVGYDEVFALEDINEEFADADAAFVVGANDIVNQAAQNISSSPLYGMPVLKVWESKIVFVVKRSMSTGYSGIDNPLFYNDNTMMLFGDAKDVLHKIVKYLEEGE